MDKIDIDLMGRQYSVSVKPEEKETLLAAVALVDERLRKLAGKSASGGEALVALMTALDIANEFVTHQRAEGLDLPDYRRRINSLGERFEQVLAKQEKLF